MKKLLLSILFLSVLSATSYAVTISKNNVIYLSKDGIVNLTCDVHDSGVGMDQGKAKFRVMYDNDNTTSEWTEEQDYNTNIQLTLTAIDVNRSFKIQGLFSDSLGNWSEPITTQNSVVIDDSNPDGTIKININITINLN